MNGVALARCRLCQREPFRSGDGVEEMPEQICRECRGRDMLPPPSEPMRPRTPCAHCQSRSFVRCRAIRERVGPAFSWLASTFFLETPVGQTFAYAGPPLAAGPAGIFEAYVCRGCGLVEWYARAPRAIPIGAEYATELFEIPETEGPYR